MWVFSKQTGPKFVAFCGQLTDIVRKIVTIDELIAIVNETVSYQFMALCWSTVQFYKRLVGLIKNT